VSNGVLLVNSGRLAMNKRTYARLTVHPFDEGTLGTLSPLRFASFFLLRMIG
jgi:hypothetical protein